MAAPSSQHTLDLTNSHLRDLSSVELAPDLTVVDLTANRLSKLEPALLALTGLVSLNLRQNILPEASELSTAAFRGSLQDLELRDNLLPELPALPEFSSLTRLECSYNQIRSLAPLTSLAAAEAGGDGGAAPPLRELFCAANKVAAIEALSGLPHLTLLELGSNRVRQIEGLEANTALAELWLGRNRISHIEGLATLGRLQRISLQSNRLESMAGLGACTSLVELYLSHNGIWALDSALTKLTGLKVLDVSNNRISRVEHLQGLTLLQDLWLNDNQIPSLDGLQDALADQRGSLTTIYLEHNPAAGGPGYRQALLDMFPRLQQLDADVLEVADQIKQQQQERRQQQQQQQQGQARRQQQQQQPGQQPGGATGAPDGVKESP